MSVSSSLPFILVFSSGQVADNLLHYVELSSQAPTSQGYLAAMTLTETLNTFLL